MMLTMHSNGLGDTATTTPTTAATAIRDATTLRKAWYTLAYAYQKRNLDNLAPSNPQASTFPGLPNAVAYTEPVPPANTLEQSQEMDEMGRKATAAETLVGANFGFTDGLGLWASNPGLAIDYMMSGRGPLHGYTYSLAWEYSVPPDKDFLRGIGAAPIAAIALLGFAAFALRK